MNSSEISNSKGQSEAQHAAASNKGEHMSVRRNSRVRKYLLLAAAGATLSTLAGCVLLGDKLDQLRWHLYTVPFYVFDNAPNYNNPPQPKVMDEKVNFAIAISGGGTRSAVFAAGVMEQLAYLPSPTKPSQTLLDSAEAISAVSGGSLAAAYYGLYKPVDFSDPEATSAFFQRFKSNMTTDFTFRGAVHYLSHPWEAGLTYYTRYRMAQTLANTFDQYLFKGATFEHLQERELCGESPSILLNATSLDTGQKFIFSNLQVCNQLGVDPVHLADRLPSLVPKTDVAPLALLGQIVSSPIYRSVGFDSINSDIGTFRLASAVAASSAYPIIPGQYALIDYSNNGYMHLADGGVSDNFGVDALISLYLRKLEQSSRGKRLVVLSINASLPLEPKRQGDPDGYVSGIEYGERASVIMATRGQTLATGLYNASSSIRVIPINLVDAMACERLSGEGTSYSISEQDMHVVLQAAAELIQGNRDAILSAIAGR